MVLTLALVDRRRRGSDGAERQWHDSPTPPNHCTWRPEQLALLRSRLSTRGHDTAQSQGHPSRAQRAGRRSSCFGRREDAHALSLGTLATLSPPNGKTATGSLATPRPSPPPTLAPRPTPVSVRVHTIH